MPRTPDEMDPRLVEHLAAALCWAEHPAHPARTDTPAEYWRATAEAAKTGYRRDARLVAAALCSNAWAIIPVDPTTGMVEAANHADGHLKTPRAVRAILEGVVAAYRGEVLWRQPSGAAGPVPGG